MMNINLLLKTLYTTENYVLDIDHILMLSEDIFSKYLTLPNGLVYVKGKRYNISNKENIFNVPKIMLSDKPASPVLSVEYMVSILSSYIINKSNIENFEINKAIKLDFRSGSFSGRNFLLELGIAEDTTMLIYDYIPNISNDDYLALKQLTKELFLVVDQYITPDNSEKIHVIEYEHETILLKFFENIKSYRYDEYLEYKRSMECENNERYT